MAEVVQKLRREILEEKRRSRTRRILALLFVFFLLAVATAIWWYVAAHTYKGYVVTSEFSATGQLPQYQSSGNSLIMYHNDGAKAISGNGTLLWEMSYQMDHPAAASCGNVAAVADIGGKNVYVIAENGMPYNYQVLYPIVKHAVAGQGVTAVLLDNGTEDYIQLYDINGNLSVDINTKTKTDGFPIGLALSEDGKKLVTLYLTFDGDALISKATFYNVGEVGKSHIGNIVGQNLFENTLAYDIIFLNNETVCILKEDGFSLYEMKEIPRLLYEKSFETGLYDIICARDCFAVVTEDAATKQKTMVRYNEKGKETATWKTIPDYETLVLSKEEIILFNSQKATIYRNNKSEKFSGGFGKSLEALFPAGGNRYFLIDMEGIRTIKLSETKEEGK